MKKIRMSLCISLREAYSRITSIKYVSMVLLTTSIIIGCDSSPFVLSVPPENDQTVSEGTELSVPEVIIQASQVNTDQLSVTVTLGGQPVATQRNGDRWSVNLTLAGSQSQILEIIWSEDLNGMNLSLAEAEPIEVGPNSLPNIVVENYVTETLDEDSDGLSNLAERVAGTDPFRARFMPSIGQSDCRQDFTDTETPSQPLMAGRTFGHGLDVSLQSADTYELLTTTNFQENDIGEILYIPTRGTLALTFEAANNATSTTGGPILEIGDGDGNTSIEGLTTLDSFDFDVDVDTIVSVSPGIYCLSGYYNDSVAVPSVAGNLNIQFIPQPEPPAAETQLLTEIVPDRELDSLNCTSNLQSVRLPLTSQGLSSDAIGVPFNGRPVAESVSTNVFAVSALVSGTLTVQVGTEFNVSGIPVSNSNYYSPGEVIMYAEFGSDRAQLVGQRSLNFGDSSDSASFELDPGTYCLVQRFTRAIVSPLEAEQTYSFRYMYLFSPS